MKRLCWLLHSKEAVFISTQEQNQPPWNGSSIRNLSLKVPQVSDASKEMFILTLISKTSIGWMKTSKMLSTFTTMVSMENKLELWFSTVYCAHFSHIQRKFDFIEVNKNCKSKFQKLEALLRFVAQMYSWYQVPVASQFSMNV